MLYKSTAGKAELAGFFEALMQGIAPDGGLYTPDYFPISLEVDGDNFPDRAGQLLWNFAPRNGLNKLCHEAFNFPIPLKQIHQNLFVLELFHGPTLSFKDFGARFMARAMESANRGSGKDLNVIVATSGDTGSAVADAFYKVPGVKVFVLYPKGRVTELQEKQMATLRENIFALEVSGDFDDCQRLAKELLGDAKLRRKFSLSSANSINIGRLLPQMTYYFEAARQLRLKYGRDERPIFVVPSGNFGNLTAGLFAKKMGLPVELFVAAVNVNSAIPNYLATGKLAAAKTKPTLSNAMDVGRPSNWDRIVDLYGGDPAKIKMAMRAVTVTDEETRLKMQYINDELFYAADPHTAVGIQAAYEVSSQGFSRTPFIVLSTAHPAKFPEVMSNAGVSVQIPARLAAVMGKENFSIAVKAEKEAILKIIKDAQ